MSDVAEQNTRLAFGAWLLKQDARGGLIGDLAKSAKADRRFPREGDPEAVRARLQELQVDGDVWAAIDDAENDWLCL